MSLGETIYRLRTEKNLSQGDLAEMLEVSRQSVSKWENNSAVPDLEKIIKLGDIFKNVKYAPNFYPCDIFNEAIRNCLERNYDPENEASYQKKIKF